ncbi:MAG: DcrB-related protein [Polyangiaceae bacterium]|nr:DcrB-related protein [Polyangiaceae bacterium]
MSVMYHMDDVVASVPDGFVDGSVHTLTWEADDGSKVGVVVQRDPSAFRPSVDELFTTAMAEYAKRLPMLQIEEAPELELSAPYRAASIRWKREGDVVYQVQLFVQLSDRNLIASFTGRARYREAIDELAREFCGSLTVRASS